MPVDQFILANTPQRSRFMPVYSYTYSTNKTDANFNTELQTVGWDGSTKGEFTIIVNSGVTLSNGADTGNFPAGSTLALVNNGSIKGVGGAAGAANFAGSAGGDELTLGDTDITITNGSGEIHGGGGGGGGGRTGVRYRLTNENDCGAVSCGTGGSGGGGAGSPTGSGTQGGVGGPGGAVGVAGTAGSTGGCAASACGPAQWYNPATPGGAAGKAIELNGQSVTWISGSGSPNVAGAVS